MRMITSENLWCARAIALKCNLIDKKESLEQWVCTEGPIMKDYTAGLRRRFDEFNECVKEEVVKKIAFKTVCSKLRVLSRCDPEVKYLMVTGLKEDAVVACTGNGVNDVNSIKKADVGISLGTKEGCEITKNYSQIVLLDLNFSAILQALMWGRTIYSNVRKFMQLQLTINLVITVVILSGALLNGESFLCPIQMLWINIVMDTLGALSLATEPPSMSVMTNQKPLKRNESVVTPVISRNIILCAGYQVFVLLFILLKGPIIFNLTYKLSDGFYHENGEATHKLQLYTLLFHTMVMMTNCQMINSRRTN